MIARELLTAAGVCNGSTLHGAKFVGFRLMPRGAGAGQPATRTVPPGAGILLANASPFGGLIEIEASGARIRIESGVELTTLSTVLSALRGGVIALRELSRSC